MMLRGEARRRTVQLAILQRETLFVAGVALVVIGACARKESAPSGAEPVQVIRHSFLPRLEKENYWEPVILERDDKNFLLLLHPRLEAPIEGPWTLTIRNAKGEEVVRKTGLLVDVATGAITLLCEASAFPKGDWTITLDLEEGGRTSGPTEHKFRFRVQ
jgi:hypothetical protein